MKLIKKLFVIFALFGLAMPAFADNQLIDSLIGAAVGGGGARALCHNCNTRNRNMATAVGALGGAWVGSSVGDSTNQRFNPPQSVQYYGGSYRESVRQVVPIETTYVREETPIHEDSAIRSVEPVRIIPRDRGCDDEYYRGQYNPELAHAYCEGRRARARQLQEAYQEGYSGR